MIMTINEILKLIWRSVSFTLNIWCKNACQQTNQKLVQSQSHLNTSLIGRWFFFSSITT